jgi:hypothetical protein
MEDFLMGEDDMDTQLAQLYGAAQQRGIASTLQNSENPYAGLGLQLAGGVGIDPDYEALRQQKIQSLSQPAPDTSGRDAMFKIGGGLVDSLSRLSNAQMGAVDTLTGIQSRPHPTTNASAEIARALASRDTMARQRALEDQKMLGAIEAIKAKRDASANALKKDADLKSYREKMLEAATGKSDTKADNRNTDIEINLRKEYQNLDVTKDTQKIASAFNGVKAAGKNPSAAGDLSLIFSYMKMLDPGSTVREGEFANAQNAAGVPEQVINIYNRAKSGERLSPNQRADFINQAGAKYKAQLETQKQFDDQYKELAMNYGANPKNILRSYAAPEVIKGTAPGAGKSTGGVKKPKQVIQNGNVYTLNEKTGDYE